MKLSTNLLLELLHDGHVDGEWVFLGRNRHGSVVDSADGPSEVADGLGGELSLLCDRGGELASVILDILEVCLDLLSQLLQVLDDGRFDGPSEGRVRVGDQSGLVTNSVENIL